MGLISTTDNCYRNIRDLSVITLLFVLKDIIHVSLLWNYSPWIWIQAKTELIIILVTQSCLTLCDRMDYSPPGSSVHGISQERRLEWAVISFSRGSSWLRDPTNFSCTTGRFFTTEPQGKPYTYKTYIINNRFSSHLYVVEIEVLTHQVLILWCVYVYIYIYC